MPYLQQDVQIWNQTAYCNTLDARFEQLGNQAKQSMFGVYTEVRSDLVKQRGIPGADKIED